MLLHLFNYLLFSLILSILLYDNSTAENNIVAREYCGLTGCDGGKWFVKFDEQGVVGRKGYRTTIFLLAVADFDDDIISAQKLRRVDYVPIF